MTRQKLKLDYAIKLLDQLNDLKIKFDFGLITNHTYNQELERIKEETKHL